MAGWISPRLRPLLGSDLDGLTEDVLSRLLELSEDSDLEFKSDVYEQTDAGKKELAADIAQFANAAGGLLFIGVVEDGSGRAADLVPIEKSIDVGLRIHQVIADRVAPPVPMRHRAITVSNGAVHVVSVPPSRLQPHAVSVGGGALRYPMRSGSMRRWLTEAEIADRYHRRLTASLETANRLNAIHVEAAYAVPTEDREDLESWLVVAAVPDDPGRLELRHGVADEWRSWINAMLGDFPSWDRAAGVVRPGFMSLRLSQHVDPNEPAYSQAAELRIDGSGYLILRMQGGDPETGTADVYDAVTVGDLVNATRVLATHANRTGAFGDLHLSAQLRTSGGPLALAEYAESSWRAVWATHEVSWCTGVTRHTGSIEHLRTPGADLVAFIRAVAADLVSAFGLPEPSQITLDGRVVVGRFPPKDRGRVADWCTTGGVLIA